MGYQGGNITFDPPALEEIDIPFGGTIRFHATVHNHSSEAARVAIGYVMHHRRNSGVMTPKVSKPTTAEIALGEAVKIERAHSFRAITRRYSPGTHAVALQVNGVTSPLTPFELLQSTS